MAFCTSCRRETHYPCATVESDAREGIVRDASGRRVVGELQEKVEHERKIARENAKKARNAAAYLRRKARKREREIVASRPRLVKNTPRYLARVNALRETLDVAMKAQELTDLLQQPSNVHDVSATTDNMHPLDLFGLSQHVSFVNPSEKKAGVK